MKTRKAPAGASIQVRKDSNYPAHPQETAALIPPCCYCDRWNACGGIGYAWVSCMPFREFMRTSRRAAAERAWKDQVSSKTVERYANK